MVSMSYCRFRNTEIEMDACLNAIDDRDELSEEEKESANRLFRKIIIWLDDNDIIDLDDNDDPHIIEEIISECNGE